MAKTRAWLKYNREGEIIEIIVRDSGGGKIETFKFSSNDLKRKRYVMNVLKSKYGVDFAEKKEKDISWLDNDF